MIVGFKALGFSLQGLLQLHGRRNVLYSGELKLQFKNTSLA